MKNYNGKYKYKAVEVRNQQIFKNGTMDLLNNLIKMVVFKKKISPFDNTFGY